MCWQHCICHDVWLCKMYMVVVLGTSHHKFLFSKAPCVLTLQTCRTDWSQICSSGIHLHDGPTQLPIVQWSCVHISFPPIWAIPKWQQNLSFHWIWLQSWANRNLLWSQGGCWRDIGHITPQVLVGVYNYGTSIINSIHLNVGKGSLK